MGFFNNVDVSVLKGKTLTEITKEGDDEIFFKTSDGETYQMYHEQDCCESVWIEDMVGELQDLIGTPLLMAEEETVQIETDWGSQTSTWYKFASITGYVTIRWVGESNGYYSESVDFKKVERG